jgi:fructose-1-phosphate kinase PfkB-like protein
VLLVVRSDSEFVGSDYARMRGKLTAIDADGDVLHVGLLAHPVFMKPNTKEFFRLTRTSTTSSFVRFATHTALTFEAL